TVLERKAPPTFDILIEIQHKDRLVIHRDVAEAVDAMLRGYLPRTELRERQAGGEFTITEAERITARGDSAARNGSPHRGRQRETTENDGRGATGERKKKRLRI